MSDIIDQNQGNRAQTPTFLREKLNAEYGEEARRIEAGYAEKRPVTLRVNSLLSSDEEVAAFLSAEGIAFKKSWIPNAFLLKDVQKERIETLSVYREGKIYLQSFSSMLPPFLLDPQAGETILDMAAAPGGKTAQIAALSGGRALITACEKDPVRYERLLFNLRRQGVKLVNAMRTDALHLDDFFRFDKILLDAPCSGSGTFSADEPIRIKETWLEARIKTQRALLRKALGLLKRGGTLVYSTCSVFKEENERQIEAALETSDCELIPIPERFTQILPLLSGRAGTATVCPSELYEGFFLAILKKRS